MLRIRLRQVGAKRQRSYRIVVADRRSPRDGKFIESIGYYNPRTEPITFHINEERALYWLSRGAQPSEPVERLLRKAGTLDRFARLQAGEPLEELLAEAKRESEAKAKRELEVKAKEAEEEAVEEKVEEEQAVEEKAEEEQPVTEEETEAKLELVGEPEESEEGGGSEL